MLQLLQPIWLMAMAGIAFPVIIHLWNNKQGKVLSIGSIAFLEKGSRKQARSRRLSEWWLLLLRCLLLLLLALLLSGPFWRRSSAWNGKKGWVLTGEEEDGAQMYKPLIDSLLKAGYERHEIEEESKSRDGRIGRGAEIGVDRERPSYWDLFRIADRAAPAGVPFYVFTSGRRSGFAGKRPVTGRIVHWYTYTASTDPASNRIGQAWLCTSDSIRVLTGSSGPVGSSYSYQLLPAKAGAAGPGGYHVGLTKGHLSVTLDSQPPVIVDTAALHMQIYADNKYTNDSRYLMAAIHALQAFTRKNIQVTVSGSMPAPSLHTKPAPHFSGWVTRSDWVFWLSSQPVPGDLPADNIVCYEPGREIPVDTWMQGMTGVAVEKLAGAEPASEKAGPGVGSQRYPAIWKDGFGRPILTLETSSGRRIFHFFSHFDPAWNGLVWSPRFPVFLQDLLATPALSGGRGVVDQDYRVLDPGQIVPQKVSPEEREDIPLGERGDFAEKGDIGIPITAQTLGEPVLLTDRIPSDAIDLAPACRILVFLFFLTERMLSFRSPKLKSYG